MADLSINPNELRAGLYTLSGGHGQGLAIGASIRGLPVGGSRYGGQEAAVERRVYAKLLELLYQ
jgi:hypothetical protein